MLYSIFSFENYLETSPHAFQWRARSCQSERHATSLHSWLCVFLECSHPQTIPAYTQRLMQLAHFLYPNSETCKRERETNSTPLQGQQCRGVEVIDRFSFSSSFMAVESLCEQIQLRTGEGEHRQVAAAGWGRGHHRSTEGLQIAGDRLVQGLPV